MIACPWCGTSYEQYQSFCSQCGGSLPVPAGGAAGGPDGEEGGKTDAVLPAPPPPPRSVPRNAVLRILLADGVAVASLVFLLLGLVFGPLGAGLSLATVTAPVGLPFAALGILFLVAGGSLLFWRLQVARRRVSVLEQGQATQGEVVSIRQEYRVRVNGRYPWVVDYTYRVRGSPYEGRLASLSLPDASLRPGQATWVLYLGGDPAQSTLYPSPYVEPA